MLLPAAGLGAVRSSWNGKQSLDTQKSRGCEIEMLLEMHHGDRWDMSSVRMQACMFVP